MASIAYPIDFKIGIFSSPNLKSWKPESNFTHYGLNGLQYECPNMVEIRVEDPSEGAPDYMYAMLISINCAFHACCKDSNVRSWNQNCSFCTCKVTCGVDSSGQLCNFMSYLINPFTRSSRAEGAWFCAGPASSYPIVDGTTRLGDQQSCQGQYVPGCRIFHVPREDSSMAREVAIDDWKDPGAGNTKDQVVVFQYKGKFIAVDHECPHSSYPLSKGTPFDIEDFGVVLSSGINCPKHEWSFDLHTGQADRGSYKLHIWEVQQRPSQTTVEDDMDIWIRRKQKIG